MKKTIGHLLFIAAVAAPASAQVQTLAVPMRDAFETSGRTVSDLKTLTDIHNKGDWDALQTLGAAIVADAKKTANDQANTTADKDGKASWTAVASVLDPSSHFIALTWVGSDAFGKTMLKRFVLHRSSVKPFTADLPGVSSTEFVELFLARTVRAKAVSLYASTREQDPIETALPEFVKALAAPLFATVGAVAGTLQGDALVNQPPPLAVTAKRVALPFARASIHLLSTAKDPLTPNELSDLIANLKRAVKFGDVPYSICARDFTDQLAKIVENVAKEAKCAGDNATAEGCKDRFIEEMNKLYDGAKCAGATPSPSELSAIQTADKRFRAFVETGQSSTADLDITFHNRPPTHFTLGAGGAVIAKANISKPRVKLKDNVIVADPLDRVMTMAFVNWSPAGYDTESARPSAAERIRFFFGAGLTPDFGGVIGVNTLLVRGIGVAVGGAFLFGKGAPSDQIGKAPVSSTDPFELAFTKAAFVGITYSYK